MQGTPTTFLIILFYHIREMKTTIISILALIVLLALKWPDIHWVDWIDGVAFGAVGFSLFVQVLKKYYGKHYTGNRKGEKKDQ